MSPPKPRALPESHSELKIVMVQFFAASLMGFQAQVSFFVRSCKLAPNDDVKICRNLRACH